LDKPGSPYDLLTTKKVKKCDANMVKWIMIEILVNRILVRLMLPMAPETKGQASIKRTLQRV